MWLPVNLNLRAVTPVVPASFSLGENLPVPAILHCAKPVALGSGTAPPCSVPATMNTVATGAQLARSEP